MVINSIRACTDLVLIKPIQQDSTTAGGIYIPDAAKEAPQFAIVVDVGPQVPEDLKPGDKVIFSRYAGTPVDVGGEKHKIVSHNQIWVVLEND